ncbi:hypothetical protein NP493_1278g00025 [Ridgeia piscesae]|uniref:CLASP N-terminal domain-containing protein n=1 Tax=Ridgeia piscesae TaxID=27915 RepID=A0AAD9KA80_RIDPI|nr:hypothetical protein NP493_1278g00025 [Ridgeia piscesae]
MRLATSRIIRWVSEPGSVEIRKMALDVLCSMYRMNNDEFITMLCELPRAFQESAVKMLHVEQSTLDRLGCVPLQRLMARRRRPHNRHTERTEASGLGRVMSECTTIEDAMSIDSFAPYAESEDMTNASKV